jgi:hypothetical protein
VRNQTAGDGNCFFHALHEAQSGARSSVAAQATLRRHIVETFESNSLLRISHFGSGNEEFTQFRVAVLTRGEWAGDQVPAMVADALGLRIVIHRPDGSIYFDARPNSEISPSVSGLEVHVCYTGNHYDSYTQFVLP